MSRLSSYIIPFEEIGSDEPRCLLCSSVFASDELTCGVCDECFEAIRDHYKALISEAFSETELKWMREVDVTCGSVSDWLAEAVGE